MSNEWKVPEWSPEPARVTAASSAAVAEPVLPPPVPRPVPMRPLTASDIVDGAFAVIKARPRVIVGLSVAFVVPVEFMTGYLSRNLLGGASLSELFADPETAQAASEAGQSNSAFVLILLLHSLTLPYLTAALARVMWGWLAGVEVSVREALGVLRGTWWALLVSWMLVHAAEAVGLVLLVLPALAIMALFSLTAPVIALEGLGPLAAMKRSWRLVSKRFMTVLWLNVLVGFCAYLLSQFLPLLPTVIGLLIGLDVGWLILAVAGVAVSLITLPFVAAATVLIYFDARMRTEGLDIEMDMMDRFPGAS